MAEKRSNYKPGQYADKVVLAPMVRVGTLPMRLLALEYGADLVYCEEIIDRKILMCQRLENELLGTTDFVLSDGTIVFRTCPQEKDRLVFQIGTSDANRALAAAKKIEDCVSGIDVNMGCPKEFSIKGGMGAALITNPDKVKKILTTLVSGLSIPVTCKIRVLPEIEDTLNLVKLIESTGVSAIGVHGRTKKERPGDANRNHYIQAVAQAVNIPVIANGGSKDITSLSDIHRFRQQTSASSVMVARAAEWNCSVFREEGPLEITTVIKRYLEYAFTYDNQEMNTKYCVLQMFHDKMTEMPEGDLCLAAKSTQDFADIFGMQEQYSQILKKRKERETVLVSRQSNNNMGVKKRKLEDGSVCIELPVRYDKRLYSITQTPKQTLNNWLVKDKLGRVTYHTMERPDDRQFNSRVTLEGKTYSNPYWEKSKQVAEQSAALACLIANGQGDGTVAESNPGTEELHRKWINILSQQQQEEGKEEKDTEVSANQIEATRPPQEDKNGHSDSVIRNQLANEKDDYIHKPETTNDGGDDSKNI